MMKKYIIMVVAIIFVSVAIIDAKRPNYRRDYRYEKAFEAFYKLHLPAVTWHHARIRCEAEGTELIVPETLDEADSMPILITPILSRFQGVYVGIHDLYSERSFVALNGHTLHDTILDLLWELKQPLHSGGRCVAMRRTGKLFVHPCSEPLPFVCKIKVSDIKYYPDCDSYDSRWKLGPNGTCYIIHVEPQTWHEAFATCFSAGGHLAILNSREEAEYIRDLFKQVDQSQEEFAFLGFSDLFQKYHYRTVHGDRLAEKEVNWDFKCPGNSSTTKLDDRCGGFRRTGLLATAPCDIPSMFFCEKPANTSDFKNTLRKNPSGRLKIIRMIDDDYTY